MAAKDYYSSSGNDMVAALDSGRSSVPSVVSSPALTPLSEPESGQMPIAIIGMACRFAGGASNPAKLWDLLAEGRSAWSEIRRDRFNAEAWYHPDNLHSGTHNVKGAHFLEEDIALFDAPFFNFPSDTASPMDPEIRLQLETVYEALENAGIPVEDLVGTDTAAFIGTAFRDMQDSHMRDPGAISDGTFITGNGAAFVANRVSHFYDLRGPSVMVDTGCSTAMTLMHLACQSLRLGESRMAIVGGSNVILNPEMFVAGTKLGFFSDEGKSFTFDSRANGYGRGEGMGSIILKPLADALRNGDAVRAIIRHTGINQDGKTTTLTAPSPDAQFSLMQSCYEEARLDPAETGYVEAHGTGTQAGDVIEANAVGKFFGESRESDRPLVIGSVKTNIGHTEAASGMAAVIKVVMALENGLIPPHINYESPNPKIDLDKLKLKIPLSLQPWPAYSKMRASINNFGYGGANSHAIIEHPKYLLGECSKLDGPFTTGDGIEKEARSRVFVWSAKDKTTGEAMTRRLLEYLRGKESQTDDDVEQLLDRLAFTLGQRRSRFPWIMACSASTLEDLVALLDEGTSQTQPSLAPQRSSRVPRLGFVFTGQGAQWYAMGRELLSAYPVFKDTLLRAQECLYELGATWSLIEELTRDEATTHVNEVAFSLPLSVAIQLALVDLLKSWGICPAGVTGHSSGEVSAAYAAGCLTLKGALAVVYCRGDLTTQIRQRLRRPGGMIAVGLSREEAQKRIARVTAGEVVVACVNSPSSVTVSGDLPAVLELEAMMKEESVFARRLKVEAAYHSPHMQPIAEPYREVLSRLLKPARDDEGLVVYSSPTTGDRIHSVAEIAGADHWVKNMVQPVEFFDCLTNMCIDKGKGNAQCIDVIVEVGPHGALGGPIKQTLMGPELKKLGVTYASCLTRGEDAVRSMQSLVSALLQRGYPVDLKAVNFPLGFVSQPRILTDLPPYPWNHQTRYWKEPRLSRALRERNVAPHDLLGRPTADYSTLTPTWRNVIRPREIPWVRDHVVQSNTLYPGAGYICMAIEAMRQIAPNPANVTGYRLEGIDIVRAMVVEDEVDGVDVRVSLTASSDRILRSQGWHDFQIQSYNPSGNWTLHCEGRIAVTTKDSKTFTWHDEAMYRNVASDSSTSWRDVTGQETYEALQTMGLTYGPMFQNQVSSRVGDNRAKTIIRVADTRSVMPARYQESHVIHPTTLDTLFQAMFHTLPPTASRKRGAMVPRTIRSLYVSANISSEAGHLLEASSQLDILKAQGFESSATITDAEATDEKPLLTMYGLFCQSLGGSSVTAQDLDKDRLCFSTAWKPDVDMMMTFPLPERHREESVIRESELKDARMAALFFMVAALQPLGTDGVQTEASQSYRAWMKDTVINNVCDLIISEDSRKSLMNRIPHSSADGVLLSQIGQNLSSIIAGQVDPVEMMRGQYQQQAAGLAACKSRIQEIVELTSHKTPQARVLEIGAGNGECSRVVLDALSTTSTSGPRCGRYDITDPVSDSLDVIRSSVESADQVGFQVLDIDADITDQGLERSSYDLIVASPLIYTARDIKQCLIQIRSLLKPSGKLLVWGPSLNRVDVSMMYKTLPGWHDAAVDASTASLAKQWSDNLSVAGLRVISAEDITIAMPESENTESIPKCPVALVYSSPAPAAAHLDGLVQAVSRRLSSHTVTSLALDQTEGLDDDTFVVFLGELTGSLLDKPTAQQFTHLQSLLLRCRGVMWVSQGAQIDSSNPSSSLHHGLLRTLRCENTSKHYVSLDLDPAVSQWDPSTADHIVRVLSTALESISNESGLPEVEYAVRSGVLQIPRIYEDAKQNNNVALSVSRQVPELQGWSQGGKDIKLVSTARGLLENLTFVEDPAQGKPLADELVELTIKACGLNFRDLMVALDHLQEERFGFEGSGVLTKVGPRAAAAGYAVGDRVYGMIMGSFATTGRAHFGSLAHLPDWMDYETGASLAMVHITAYHSLHDIARLRAGESVLIHSGSGGVGQSAVMIAQNIGAEVFVTVGSAQKREFMMDKYGIPEDHIFSSHDASFADEIMARTSGKGVDVVLNSLAGSLLRATWSCIARFGRFVEIGKRDIELDSSIGMATFARCVSFSSVDLLSMHDHRFDQFADLIGRVASEITAKKLGPVAPLNVFPMAEYEQAFRFMQEGTHMGKIVLTPTEADMVKVLPSSTPVILPCDASYLIVGGLGGIGKSASKMLVESGARHLVLVSRSAESPNVENEAFVRELQVAGANVVLKSCDVANEGDLEKVLSDCADSLPPIRGVIQSAMVLRDSIFEKMSFKDYETVIQGKVQGTWNLHNLTTHLPLEFFIMLSSISGAGGNAGQANYAAGGTFQDALARHRASLGLPGVALDLGAVKSVGVLSQAENLAIANHLAKVGLRALEEEEVLRLIESAIRCPRRDVQSSQIITGIPSGFVRSTTAAFWNRDVRWAPLERADSASTSGNGGGAAVGSAAHTKALLGAVKTADEAAKAVTGVMVTKLATEFGRSESDIDPSLALTDFGVDSLVAVELRNWIMATLDAECSIFDVMQSPSLAILVEKLVTKSRLINLQAAE